MGLVIEELCVEIEKKDILKSINLQIQDGEFFSLLGPSGCGKSTLLKTLGGFLAHQGGRILVDGKDIDAVPPHLRQMVIVFQDLRLFPHLSAWENVAFPLRMRGMSKKERREEAVRLLEKVGLAGMESRRIGQLSGGQQQRVALARAFAARPRFLLLDEPFSSLDEALREEMRSLVAGLHEESGVTVILVTHDKSEAIMLSDRMAVMRHGEMLQCGTPQEVYEHPASLAVAEYFGDSNLLEGVVENGLFTSGDLHFGIPVPDGRGTVSIPYHAVKPVPEGGDYSVRQSIYTGTKRKITIECGSKELICMTETDAAPVAGQKIGLSFLTDKMTWFDEK